MVRKGKGATDERAYVSDQAFDDGMASDKRIWDVHQVQMDIGISM